MRFLPLSFELILGLALSSAAFSCADSDASSAAADSSDSDSDSATTKHDIKVDGSVGSNAKVDAASGSKKDAAAPSSPAKSDAGGSKPVSKSDAGGIDGSPAGAMDADMQYPHPDGYLNLAVQPGEAFDPGKGDTHPMSGYTPPAGWTWNNIEGAKCRDGSPFGVMTHWSQSKSTKLFIYFEGGGACANPGFCTLNPADVNHQFSGKGQLAIASITLENTAQDPGTEGIFNFSESTNPYKDWNFIYILYCTGDVHFGGNPNGKIEGVTETLNFSGAANTKAVIARALATWPDTTRFIAGGSSAGGYGAGLNYGVIQDSFANAEGSVLLDASPPFSNEYAPACLQKRWRESEVERLAKLTG